MAKRVSPPTPVCLWPEEGEAEITLGTGLKAGISVLLCIDGDTFRKKTQYPVIVEMWGKQYCGRVQREWLKQFTEKQRKLLGRYHTAFYKWHLISGTPRHVHIKPNTLELILRASAFFGTI